MPRQQITEERPLREAASSTARAGRLRVEVITPGWGSSGYYPQAVLEAAGRDGVIAAGTHMYANHMTESEQYERPERSVLDLAAITTSPAVWDATAGADGTGALVAEAQVLPAYRDAFVDETFLGAIGVSIHGSGNYSQGEAAGRTGAVFSRITEVNSVDFVTHAGRGGRVTEILESARGTVRETERDVPPPQDPTPPQPDPAPDPAAPPAADPAAAPVPDRPEEQVARESLPGGLTGSGLRAAISAAVDAEYDRSPSDGDPSGYVWSYVRDWTDETVVFALSGSAAPTHRLWAQSYTVSDAGVAALTGEAVPVVVETRYLLVGADGTPGAPVFSAVASTDESDRATLRVDAAPADADAALDGPAVAAVRGLAESLRADRRPTPPSQPAGSTSESRREGTSTMPNIEESRLRQLEAAESARPALEAERDSLRTQLAESQRRTAVAEAREYATTFARTRVREANAELPQIIVDRIVAESTREIPLGDDNRLDTTVLGATVDEARTREETYLAGLLEESGAGTVRGVGSTAGPGGDRYGDDVVESELAGLFGRTIQKG